MRCLGLHKLRALGLRFEGFRVWGLGFRVWALEGKSDGLVPFKCGALSFINLGLLIGCLRVSYGDLQCMMRETQRDRQPRHVCVCVCVCMHA